MMKRLLLLTLCAAPLLTFAQKGKKDSSAALMRFLPNGTSLNNVSVPVFNDKGEPTTMLKADRVTVADKKKGEVDIFKAVVEILDETDPLFVHMEKGRYFRNKNLITSYNPVRIFKSNLEVTGTGAYFDLVSQEVFIHGPSKTTYLKEEVAALMVKQLGLLMAIPPHLNVELSDEEKRALEFAEQKAAGTADAIVAEAKTQAQESKLANAKAGKSERKLEKFVTKAGGELEKPEEKSEEAPVNRATPTESIVITNSGGTYFDAENNVVVYLQDVVAENQEMHLTCSKDLKIFLEPKNREGEKEGEEGSAIGGMGALDMKELLATGDVVITYKQKSGKPPLIATGGSAFYKMEKEEVLIKGGYPKLSQGQSSSEALETGMWVKLSRRGAVWSKGKQRQIYVPNK